MSDSLPLHWTVVQQAPLSLEFPRQEYWSGLPFTPPRDLLDPRIEPASPVSPALQADSSPAESLGKLPWWLSSKESACNAGDTGDAGSIPGLGRFPGGGYGNPL